MTEKPIHASIRRLYSAAKLVGDDAPAKVARRLNISPQTMNNWEARGISQAGSLAAQQAYGCNAVWLVTGKGDQGEPGKAPPEDHSHVLRLDPERIAELATVLAERWKDVPGGFDLRNEEHAAHFVLCYGLFINMKERPVPENTVAFSAALTSPQGAKRDERSENVPTAGTAKRRVGKGGKR